MCDCGTEGRGKQGSCRCVVAMLHNRDIIESGRLRWGWAKLPGFTSDPFGAGVFISNGVGTHCTGRLPDEKEADNGLSSLRWEKQIEYDQRLKGKISGLLLWGTKV